MPGVQAPSNTGPGVQAPSNTGPGVQAPSNTGPGVQAPSNTGPGVQAPSNTGPGQPQDTWNCGNGILIAYHNRAVSEEVSVSGAAEVSSAAQIAGEVFAQLFSDSSKNPMMQPAKGFMAAGTGLTGHEQRVWGTIAWVQQEGFPHGAV